MSTFSLYPGAASCMYGLVDHGTPTAPLKRCAHKYVEGVFIDIARERQIELGFGAGTTRSKP